MQTYFFHGFTLCSEFPLELNVADACADEAADIALFAGDVPSALANTVWTSPFIDLDADGNALVRGENGLRLLCRAGKAVVVSRGGGEERGALQRILCGVVAGILMHQRGVLALHASAVTRKDGQDGALVLCGLSIRGKSFLAAGLSAAGWQVMTDDLCRITMDKTAVLAHPGPPWLYLWPDALAHFGLAGTPLQDNAPEPIKRRVMMAPPPMRPIPVRAIVRLNRDMRSVRPALERLTGPSSLLPMENIVYRARLGRRLGQRQALFLALTRLASACPFYRFSQVGRASDLPVALELLESLIPEAGT